MNYFSFKIYLRKNRKLKSGKYPIYLRVTKNRKSKEFKIPVECFIRQWDEKNMRIKGRDDDVLRYNAILANVLKKVSDIVFQFQVSQQPKSLSDFEIAFLGEKNNYVNFFELAQSYIEQNKHDYSNETIRSYRSYLSKLNKYKPKLTVLDIDVRFINAYDLYMKNALNNNNNTRHKNLSFIRTIINYAIKEGIIQSNPFKNIRLKKSQGNRDFLTLTELQMLQNYFNELNDNSTLKNVLRYFLFACYTGLRYSDIKKLKHNNIIGNLISISMHKTKRIVSIPITKKAQCLIPENNKTGFVFKVYSNQVTNRYLKEIQKQVVPYKNLTFHVARHTFATVSIEIGIPIEVVSKLLGHADLKTTLIYARIVDNVKIKEMQKWDF